MNDLTTKHCIACESSEQAMDQQLVSNMLQQTPDWELNESAEAITRIFKFKNYYQTLAFVNAVAWLSHQEDHHPTLTVDYNRCKVLYSTHSVNGLSENDFICAAKINKLIEATG